MYRAFIVLAIVFSITAVRRVAAERVGGSPPHRPEAPTLLSVETVPDLDANRPTDTTSLAAPSPGATAGAVPADTRTPDRPLPESSR